MRPKGTAAELERRRRQAIALLEEGKTQAAVAEALGTSEASVSRWREAYEQGGETALAAKATTLVFVHNHPDGKVEPSEFDKTLTRSLVLAARTMNVSVFDHIIVSRDAYFSFRENGLL